MVRRGATWRGRRRAEVGSPDGTHAPGPGGSTRAVEQRLALQKRYATAFLILMFAQLAATNAAFFVYGWSRSWAMSDAALLGYIGATFGEIVTIVFIIVRYLFPGTPGAP
jgi:hypothetical protein